MVNNINGLTSTQSNANRSREKTQAPDAATANQDATKKPSSESGDKVELSSEAKKLQDIESNLSQLPEVDQNRVSAIKDALRDGSYSVDPARLAAKIAQFELNI